VELTLAAQYERDGYCVVPDLVPAARVAAIKARLTEIADGRASFPEAKIEYEPGAEHERSLATLRKINNPSRHDAFFLEHARSPELLAVVEQLLGPDIKLFSDQVFMKPPGGVEKTFHQDSAYFHIEPTALVTAWLAIDDVTLENGCLWVIPGSHRGGIHDHSEKWQVGDRVDMKVPEKLIDRGREVALTMSAGSCSFHHSVLLHRSGPNRTTSARRGMATHYMSARSLWSGSPDEQPEYELLRGREYAGAV
jgi:ectoine hydroxylase-related dioxygenase (phytanoyl-CoA dioxygenase family)